MNRQYQSCKATVKFNIDEIPIVNGAFRRIFINKKCFNEFIEQTYKVNIEYSTTGHEVIHQQLLIFDTDLAPIDQLEKVEIMKSRLQSTEMGISALEVIEDSTNLRAVEQYNFFIEKLKGRVGNVEREFYITKYKNSADAFDNFIGDNLLILENPIVCKDSDIKQVYEFAYWKYNKYILLTEKKARCLYEDFMKINRSEVALLTGEEREQAENKLMNWDSYKTEVNAFKRVTRVKERYINNKEVNSMILTNNNKLIDFTTNEVRECRKSDKIIYSNKYNLISKEECIEWVEENILNTYRAVLGDVKLNYLLDFISYKLKGKHKQIALFMYGNGCTGKTIFTSICRELLGNRSIKINKNYITNNHKDNDDSSRDDTLVSLDNKLLALSSEFDVNDYFNISRFKKVLSGSMEETRATLKNTRTVDLTNLDMLIDTNDIPKFTNTDNAFKRRIECLEFKSRILNPNPNFYKEVVEPNFDFIFSYFIYRALDLDKELITPDEVIKETDNVFNSISPINEFIQNHVISDNDSYVFVSEFLQELYNEYDQEEIEKLYGFTKLEDSKVNNAKILLQLLKDNNSITSSIGYKRKSIKKNNVTYKKYIIEGISLKSIEQSPFYDSKVITIK